MKGWEVGATTDSLRLLPRLCILLSSSEGKSLLTFPYIAVPPMFLILFRAIPQLQKERGREGESENERNSTRESKERGDRYLQDHVDDPSDEGNEEGEEGGDGHQDGCDPTGGKLEDGERVKRRGQRCEGERRGEREDM